MSAAVPHNPSVELLAAGAGMLAFVLIAAGCVISALGYTGTAGEPYSPLNHWISELGQEGVSARAPVFNGCLVLGGLAFVEFVAGLWRSSPSRLRWAFGPVGVLAGVGGLLVGVFPMNHPTQHVAAAAVFFNLGWVFVLLASAAFVRHPETRHPRWLAGLGAVSVAMFIGFILSLAADPFSRQRMASTGPITGRPDVWIAPTLEWAALISIMVWVLLASLAWWRVLRREAGMPG